MDRRRRHTDSQSDDEGDERGRKRRRIASEGVDIQGRLESLITRVGEKSTSSLESNLEGLAGVLETDIPNYKHQIMKILCDCVIKLPEKLTVYTTLVGLLNAKNYNCGGEFVEMLVRNLKEALKTGEFENARMMVRFLSDLVNCHVLVAASLLQMFDSFVEVTLEDNIPQVRSDIYVFLVLSSLPWVGRELFDKKENDLSNMLVTIENYLSKRQKVHLSALRVWSSDGPHPQEEYLDCLWAQIKNLRGSKWIEKQILRPYLAFDSVLCDALQHTLPQIIPPSHNKSMVYPLPRVIFRLFNYTDVPQGTVLPGSHAIERYLIEEQINRIIDTTHRERKECAAALLGYPAKNKIPLNYMLVEEIYGKSMNLFLSWWLMSQILPKNEWHNPSLSHFTASLAMFGQMFQLPRAPYLDLFFGSTFIELCKLQPTSMPEVLAQASEMLFDRIETMHSICIERFVQWFSYHLSNFQYKWSWEDWSECVAMDPNAPKSKFVREVLLKCMRFSYHQRVAESVPESFAPLLPAEPKAVYRYEQEGAGSLPGTMHAHKLTSAIKTKCTPEEAAILLKDLPNVYPNGQENENSSFNPLKIDVFFSTLLHLGSKSISHSFAALAKFHPNLKSLAEFDDGKVCLLKVLYETWKNNQQMMVVLVDKLLRTEVVDCSSVANWLFSFEMQHDFTSFYVWEIMHSTIKKMSRHVDQLQQEVDNAHDKKEAVKRKEADGLDVIDDDIPSDEAVERMEEKLEAATSAQKNLFLVIFQRFIIVLTEHLARCETAGVDYNTPWYKWVIERLQQVFLLHHELVFRYINTLEQLLFTSDIDIHILEVFQQFCALRS